MRDSRDGEVFEALDAAGFAEFRVQGLVNLGQTALL